MNGYAKVEFAAIELLENIRKDTSGSKVIRESIRAVGLQNPLLVQYKHWTGTRTTDGKTVNSRYFLIDGYTRYQAIKDLREEDKKAFPEIPVVLVKCTDNEARFLMLTSNLARKEFGPIETADGLKMLQNLGYKLRDIAVRVGLSQAWCSLLVRMRDTLCSEVLAAIQAGEVSASAASGWCDLSEDKQLEALKNAKAAKAKGGKKAAKRQADRDAGRPDKPRQKELKKLLDGASVLGASDTYWRGVSNGIRVTMGLIPDLQHQIDKALKALAKIDRRQEDLEFKDDGDGKGTAGADATQGAAT